MSIPYIKQGSDRYAKFDPSISRMRTANQVHQPSWESVMIHLLKNSDQEAAEFVRAIGEGVEIERLQEAMKLTDHLATFHERAA